MSYNFSAADIDRNGKKKRPKCAKCRNHGVMVFRLGHKGCCQYDECTCDLCRQTKVRNDAMAKTMANERRRKKETGRSSSTPSSSSSDYSYSDRGRTSFALQLDGYNPASGGNLISYNANHRAPHSHSGSYTTSSSKNTCLPFSSHVDTKVFGTTGYHNFYHRAPQFPTPSYKTEPDQRNPFINPLNTFGCVNQPHLTMIGSSNK